MGELTAVLDLLQQTAGAKDDLLVYCDSKYVINSITEWMPGWKRKGWKKRDGKPVSNVEIMKALDVAMQNRQVRFEWVKGHAGHEMNEVADKLANAAAVAFRDGTPVADGPGFAAASRGAHDFAITRPEVEDDLFSLIGDDAISDEEQVIALERSLLTDDVRSDPAAVAALLDPTWSEIGASGRRWNRDEMLAEVTPLLPAVECQVLSTQRLADDVVHVVWRAQSAAGSRLRSSIWVRSAGAWRQRFAQGTVED